MATIFEILREKHDQAPIGRVTVLTIFLAILGLAIFVIAFLHIQYGIFTRYNYITAQWDKKQDSIRLLAYGKQLLTAHQQAAIAKKMGFDIVTIGGCMINTASANGADEYNKVMTNYLNEKAGKHWRIRFDYSVDSLFRSQSAVRVYEAVMGAPGVSNMIHKLDSLKPNITYVRVVNLMDRDTLHPNAWLCEDTKRGTAILGYYIVNPYTLKVKHILY